MQAVRKEVEVEAGGRLGGLRGGKEEGGVAVSDLWRRKVSATVLTG